MIFYKTSYIYLLNKAIEDKKSDNFQKEKKGEKTTENKNFENYHKSN